VLTPVVRIDCRCFRRREAQMMTTRHILALLNSHIEGDDDQFFSVALQIAAQQAQAGHSDDAEKLKRLVQKARDHRRLGAPAGGQTPIPMAGHVPSFKGWSKAPIPIRHWRAWCCPMRCAPVWPELCDSSRSAPSSGTTGRSPQPIYFSWGLRKLARL